MTRQEEIKTWAFVFLRPICLNDEHAEAYVNDLFRGLSKRGVVILTGGGHPGIPSVIEPLIKKGGK